MQLVPPSMRGRVRTRGRVFASATHTLRVALSPVPSPYDVPYDKPLCSREHCLDPAPGSAHSPLQHPRAVPYHPYPDAPYSTRVFCTSCCTKTVRKCPRRKCYSHPALCTLPTMPTPSWKSPIITHRRPIRTPSADDSTYAPQPFCSLFLCFSR